MLGMLFTEILYRPIFNVLVIFLTLFEGNLGLAIILLTVTIRLLMVKQTLAGNDMQKGMTNLQPKLAEIQEKYNLFISDKEQLNKILIEGAQKASYTAEKTLRKVYRKVGFYSVK
jgi:membrane protein insertase Oxa1/YidC/SpoIIIJ